MGTKSIALATLAILSAAGGVFLSRGGTQPRTTIVPRLGTPEWPTIRNALIIPLDDIGSDALALLGGALAIETPELETLAAQGVLFTRAYANPTCDPSRRAMLTGHWWTATNGPTCQTSGDAFTPVLSEDFLAERLSQHSTALWGKAHLGVSPTGADYRGALLEHGFDAWACGHPANLLACGGTGYGNDPLRTGGQPNTSWLKVEAYGTALTSSTEGGYEPDALEAAFLSGTLRWTAMPLKRVGVWCPQLAHDPAHAAEGNSPLLAPALKYASMIAYLDAQIGRIVATLDLTRTMVVIVGDNGTIPGFAPDPTRAKGTTYEGGVRVPMLIVGGPTLSGGRTSDELVHVVDVYQTVIDWCGGATTAGTTWPIVSHSLMPILTETSWTPREYVICGDRWLSGSGANSGDRCIVTEDGWKLRQEDDDWDGTPERTYLFQLPDETTNHLSSQASLAATLTTTLSGAALP